MEIRRLWRYCEPKAGIRGERSNVDVLVVSFGADPSLLKAAIEDAQLISRYTKSHDSRNIRTADELVALIESTSPQVLYLLAQFDTDSYLCDTTRTSLRLSELMRSSDKAGVRLFIIGSENKFEHVKKDFYSSRKMNFLTITHRNKHFSTFLTRLLEGLALDPSFPSTYVALAPQNHQSQRGRPLPGSIAVCPVETGRDIVLWSEPQE